MQYTDARNRLMKLGALPWPDSTTTMVATEPPPPRNLHRHYQAMLAHRDEQLFKMLDQQNTQIEYVEGNSRRAVEQASNLARQNRQMLALLNFLYDEYEFGGDDEDERDAIEEAFAVATGRLTVRSDF